MVQQRLKAKLMVARWGSEQCLGQAGGSKILWKRGRRQSPAKLGAQCGAGTEWKWNFCAPFSSRCCRKVHFYKQGHLSLASHGSHSFPESTGTQTRLWFCLRSGLSCCPSMGASSVVNLSWVILNQITELLESLYRPTASSVLPLFHALGQELPGCSESPQHGETLWQAC